MSLQRKDMATKGTVRLQNDTKRPTAVAQRPASSHMKKYILIPVFLGLATNTFAASEVIPIKKGMSYQMADASLRRSGWHQRTVHTSDGYEYTGDERGIKEHGVEGLERCAMDKPVCIVHYAKKNECLRIITWGEQFKDLKIDSWDKKCPAQDTL